MALATAGSPRTAASVVPAVVSPAAGHYDAAHGTSIGGDPATSAAMEALDTEARVYPNVVPAAVLLSAGAAVCGTVADVQLSGGDSGGPTDDSAGVVEAASGGGDGTGSATPGAGRRYGAAL